MRVETFLIDNKWLYSTHIENQRVMWISVEREHLVARDLLGLVNCEDFHGLTVVDTRLCITLQYPPTPEQTPWTPDQG